MATAQSILNAFRRTFPDCSQARALELLNEVDEEVLSLIPLRKSTFCIPLVAGQAWFDLPESIVRVYRAELVDENGRRVPLEETTEAELNRSAPGWRGDVQGLPSRFGTSASMTGGTGFVWPAPSSTSPVVNSITAGRPTSVGFASAHGLTNGLPVLLIGGPGGRDLKGFAKVINPTTIQLFADQALTVPLASAGATGPMPGLASPGRPLLCLDASVHVTLSESSPMPNLPQVRRLYANGMRMIWAMERHAQQAEFWRAQFERDLQAQHELTLRRATGVQLRIELVHQDPNFRSRGGSF